MASRPTAYRFTACTSSYITSKVLEFRNPQGRDQNWMGRNNSQVNSSFKHAARVITATPIMGALVVSSMVETAVYTIFTTSSLLLYPVSYLIPGAERPLSLSIRLLASLAKSSYFTIHWNFSNLGLNFFKINLSTQDCISRKVFDN